MIPNNGGSVPESQIRSPVLTGGGGGHVVEDNKALKKGPWTAAEDQILMEYVRKHGEGNWNSMQRNSGLNRCGKSCRLRWANHLRPHLKKGAFSPEEERHILALHAKYGNKWARMASQLPGRTDNEIKNYWNTRVKKRQRQGLPLYPHDISQSQQPQQSHSHSNSDSQPAKTPTFYFQTQSPTQAYHHHNLPPISPTAPSLSPLSSPHQPKPTTTMITSLPLFDPTNTTTSSLSSSSSSFNFHRPSPILGTPLGYKQYRDSAGFSPPISPNPQKSSSMLRTHSMPDFASFQLSDTNSMSGNPSSHLNDTNSIPSIAIFQLNDTTTMLGIDSFQLNNTNSMPHIVAFQLNETSSMSDIASFQLNTTNSMSDIFSCQIKNNNSMPGNITSFQLNDIGSIPDITSFPLNDTNLMSDIAPFQFSHTYPSLSPIPQSEFEYSGRFMPPTGSFYSVKSELPSNQVPQTPSEITMNTNVSSIAVTSSVEAEETHNNSGLLDDLLQEVDPLAGGGGTGNNSRRAMGVLGSCEEMHDLDGYDQWLQSTTSMESSLYGDVYVSC